MSCDTPIAYLLTVRTYATWLHGDKRASVDRERNIFDTPKISSNAAFQTAM